MAAFSGAGHLRCPLPGAGALLQVEKLRMEMLSLAPPHLCSGSDPPVPGCRSPGLKLCLRLRSGPLLQGPGTKSGLPGPQLPTPELGVTRVAGILAWNTGLSAAEGRARHAAPGAPGTSSAPLRAQWQPALTGSRS